MVMGALGGSEPGYWAVTDAEVAAVLAAYSDDCPSWRWAVVFATSCRPMRLGMNSGHDADLYAERYLAEARMIAPQSAAFRNPVLWARDAEGWHRESPPAREAEPRMPERKTSRPRHGLRSTADPRALLDALDALRRL